MAVLVDPMIGGGAAAGGLEKADATCCSTLSRDSMRYRNSLGLRRGTLTGMWQLIGYAAAAAARWSYSSLALEYRKVLPCTSSLCRWPFPRRNSKFGSS